MQTYTPSPRSLPYVTQSASLNLKSVEENSSWYPGAFSTKIAGDASNAPPSNSGSLRIEVRSRGAEIPPGRNTAVQFGPLQVSAAIPTIYLGDKRIPYDHCVK